MKRLSGEHVFLALLSEEEGACRFVSASVLFFLQHIFLHLSQLEQEHCSAYKGHSSPHKWKCMAAQYVTYEGKS